MRFFFSHLSYCHLIWGTTTQTNLEKLHRLQKKIVRIIGSTSYYEHTEPLFKQLKLLNIYSLYDYKLSISFKHDTLNNTKFLSHLAALEKNNPTYSTRHTEYWKVIRCHTNYGQQMLRYTLPRLLNTYAENNTNLTTTSNNVIRSLYI